jgi:hypothetical protein
MARTWLCSTPCANPPAFEPVAVVASAKLGFIFLLDSLIVAKGDMTVTATHFQDVEQFIEERRQKAVVMIAKMRVFSPSALVFLNVAALKSIA